MNNQARRSHPESRTRIVVAAVEGSADAASHDDDAHNGWKLLPSLFELWDFDGNGYIDRSELCVGLGRYCRQRGISPTKDNIACITVLMEETHDDRLDQREFSVGMARFAESVGVPLADLTICMRDHLCFLGRDSYRRKITPERPVENMWTTMIDNLKQETIALR